MVGISYGFLENLLLYTSVCSERVHIMVCHIEYTYNIIFNKKKMRVFLENIALLFKAFNCLRQEKRCDFHWKFRPEKQRKALSKMFICIC